VKPCAAQKARQSSSCSVSETLSVFAWSGLLTADQMIARISGLAVP